jgi:uncharacterized membrane protein
MSNINKAQAILLTLQIGSLIYCMATGRNPIETHYGFCIWGSIPIIVLNFSR